MPLATGTAEGPGLDSAHADAACPVLTNASYERAGLLARYQVSRRPTEKHEKQTPPDRVAFSFIRYAGIDRGSDPFPGAVSGQGVPMGFCITGAVGVVVAVASRSVDGHHLAQGCSPHCW